MGNRDRLVTALDIAVWGFPGEPRRCSRCNCDEGDEHSPTCPMPIHVLPVLEDAMLGRGRVTDRRLDMRLKHNRERRYGETPE